MKENRSNEPTPATRCAMVQDEKRAAPSNAESGGSAPAGRWPTLRILVADDHPISRLLLQTQLKASGYDVDLVEEGRQALTRFSQAHYDVVMTDLNMPGMDGCALARNLRSQGATVPILAFTATATDAERATCSAAGINALFTKPLQIDAMDDVVRRLIGMDVASAPAAKPDDLSHGPLPAKLHALLQQGLRQSMQAIDEALVKGDMQRVRDHLHSLRGSFAMIREMETATRLGWMEEQAAADDLEALKAALPVFAEHASSVLERRSAA